MLRPLSLRRVLASFLAIVGVVVLLAASAEARSVEIRDDLGGNIDSYQSAYQAIAQRGDDVRIGGVCASACTFAFIYVPVQKICLEPDARFMFHSVSSNNEDDPLDDLASLEIFVSYPSWLQDEISSFRDQWGGGGMLPPANRPLLVGADFFLAHGYRACDAQTVASAVDPAAPDPATSPVQ